MMARALFMHASPKVGAVRPCWPGPPRGLIVEPYGDFEPQPRPRHPVPAAPVRRTPGAGAVPASPSYDSGAIRRGSSVADFSGRSRTRRRIAWRRAQSRESRSRRSPRTSRASCRTRSSAILMCGIVLEHVIEEYARPGGPCGSTARSHRRRRRRI